MSGRVDDFEEGSGVPVVLAGVREVEVAYMNVGRSCDATHEFLEKCARKGVGVAFVGECVMVLTRPNRPIACYRALKRAIGR